MADAGAVIHSDMGEFFAPAQTGAVGHLLAQHQAMRARIQSLAEVMSGELGGAVAYFVDGNIDSDRYRGSLPIASLFDAEGAMKALHADFWRRALDLTGLRDLLPQDKRAGWDDSIRKLTTPEFSREWVETTIADLLNSRELFFAEKVDGIFRGLSGEHLTNRPEGFGKRFIFNYAYTQGSGYGYPQDRFRGYMHDLRMVVSKFMGMADPEWGSTYSILCGVKRDGAWRSIDGGTIRIRAYQKGTAHVEVHPDMAWRLNRVLAQINPRAIPSRFREPPKTRPREWATIERPLPHAIRKLVGDCHVSKDRRTVELPYLEDKHLRAQLVELLTSVGGVASAGGDFAFPYDPHAVLDHLEMIGTVPDVETHQYYPTPEPVVDLLMDMLGPIDAHDECLEPSAGQGAIACRLPIDRTTCVELAELNALVLESKGYTVQRGDFIAWAAAEKRRGRWFQAIAMNPPYSQGRAEAHVKAAASLLAPGGSLAAILPASMAGRELVAGAASHAWSEPMGFAGVSIKVCVYAARMR